MKNIQLWFHNANYIRLNLFSQISAKFVKSHMAFEKSHVFATVKSSLFLCLFFVVNIPIIVFHSYLIVNFIPKPVEKHSRLICEANLFNSMV